MARASIDALGRRLARSSIASPPDVEFLEQLQAEYSAALDPAVASIRSALAPTHGMASLAMTSRIKTPSTLIDKLRRGTRLSSVQDVIGVRIVGATGLRYQDDIAAVVASAFPSSKIVDRRARPTHGYRALHVIVLADGFLLEVQVRTWFQHVWANATERLADAWGRGIRYGLPPEGPNEGEVQRRIAAIDQWKRVAELIGRVEAETERLTAELAARVGAAIEIDPLLRPDDVARELMREDPVLMAGVNAATAAMGSALERGGSEIGALLQRSLQDAEAERRRLESML